MESHQGVLSNDFFYHPGCHVVLWWEWTWGEVFRFWGFVELEPRGVVGDK